MTARSTPGSGSLIATGATRLRNLIPRFDRSRSGPQLDTEMPAVVVRVTEFPLQHGCLGVFRSLGRAGVPVHAVVAEPDCPVARSRYVDRQILWQPQRGDTVDHLLDRLNTFGQELGRRSLIVCTGDDSALLTARHRADLAEHFVLPDVAPDLPTQLADKLTLEALCREHGVPTPRSAIVNTRSELEAALDEIEPPVVVKSLEPRGPARKVDATLLMHTRSDMADLVRSWEEPFGVLIQQYLPDESSEDWIAHGYCGADPGATVVFTGRKVRQWPPKGGSTAAAFVSVNQELSTIAADFCAKVGWRGAFDMDWRRDLRTGEYHLLDFNPRVGAQFRMFENTAGIDVVRAMHLDLSGRAIPAGALVDGERFIVEPWDAASLISDRTQSKGWPGGTGRPRTAWLASDDLAPVKAAAATQGKRSVEARLRGPRSD
jgi:predicted ATP-grasp superfamily ATP-dependent carboligase